MKGSYVVDAAESVSAGTKEGSAVGVAVVIYPFAVLFGPVSAVTTGSAFDTTALIPGMLCGTTVSDNTTSPDVMTIFSKVEAGVLRVPT